MPDVFKMLMITNYYRRNQEAKCHSNLTNTASVRIEVLTEMCIKIMVFLGVTPCSSVDRLQ
jgi:hypothetical protein